MLKTRLLHPEMLRALAASGHLSRVLIADGNFPFASRRGPNAALVFLNLTAGIPTVSEVLAVLVDMVPIQGAAMMQLPDGLQAPVQAELGGLLPAGTPLEFLERQAFYDAAVSPLTTLVVATGDSRRFANVLLTLGVVMPDAPA